LSNGGGAGPHHHANLKSCFRCGRSFRTKGYDQSTLHSVYGNVPMRVRRVRGCSCTGTQARSYSPIPTSQHPITPELKYLTAQLAALLPFGKVTDFLSELLPFSAKMTASTVRNRTLKVGKRLGQSAGLLAAKPQHEPCPEAVVGLDGAYVRARHPRPERNFEVIVGTVLDGTGPVRRFASVRNGGSETVEATRLARRQHGVDENTTVTVLTDGDAGLRAIQHRVAPQAEHVLQSRMCSASGFKYSCNWCTSSPLSERNSTCWSIYSPCERSTSNSRRFGFSS
jgi:hypothetical protein